MDVELRALNSNRTWVRVPCTENTNIVGSKWIFRTKYLAVGYVDRYKTRLVAQDFTQVTGFNFTHTFSPVVKVSTVRMNNWPLHHLDVNNVFVHGLLDKSVYMEQPPGYTNPEFPSHVFLLKKTIYGLKKAPRAWFHRFSSFLLNLDFRCNTADTSLFVFRKGPSTLYLLLYVDDIIVTRNASTLVDNLVHMINRDLQLRILVV